jgi:dihydrofolate reductase
MAYVVHSINVTITGTCYHEDVVADREHHEYAQSLLSSADSLLLGRGTFDLFEAFWPDASSRLDLPVHMADFARDLAVKPKFVASARDLKTSWSNVHLLLGADLGSVRQFLSGTSERVVVFGSPALGESLNAAGLINELQIVLQPLLGARPPRVFSHLQTRHDLSLIESMRFDSGVVVLRYAAAA